MNNDVIRRRLNKLDEYFEIDHAIVYEVLQHRLGDIESLRRMFAQFL